MHKNIPCVNRNTPNPKSDQSDNFIKKGCFKQTYELSGNDYRVAALLKSYLTDKGIIMQSLKSIGQF